GETDELPFFTLYADADGDGFGDASTALDTCLNELPGYVSNDMDCDDANLEVNPEGIEVLDGLDNDCNGVVDDVVGTIDLFRETKLFPNPVSGVLTVYHTGSAVLEIRIFNSSGQVVRQEPLYIESNAARIDFSTFATGLYFVHLYEGSTGKEKVAKVAKVN
ncbi:MAG: T9SS type A sorting domain-containing protein, partial [Saprospiraceae bacterium]|nr:T9SS type A sorting domain-containing protein [Saprospiraceae bacterium]